MHVLRNLKYVVIMLIVVALMYNAYNITVFTLRTMHPAEFRS